MLRALTAVALVATAHGHGALVSPRSRNAIDIDVGVNCVGYECDAKATATVASKVGVYGGCVNATHPGQPCINGQAAFWYSQGCFIGCPEWCGLLLAPRCTTVVSHR